MSATISVTDIAGEIDEARSDLYRAVRHLGGEHTSGSSQAEYDLATSAIQDARYRLDEAESLIREAKRQ